MPPGARSARICRLLGLALAAACFLPAAALAQANNIIRLVEQADFIAELRLKRADDKGMMGSEVVRVLKGKPAGAAPRINLATAAKGTFAERLKDFRRVVERDGPAALFFRGKDEDEDRGVIHVAGRWLPVGRGKKAPADKPWDAESFNHGPSLSGWEGGTEPLVRVVKQIVKFPQSVLVGRVFGWSDLHKLGRVGAPVSALNVVDLDGTGLLRLHAACPSGDRIYAFDARQKRFRDLTAGLGLTASSQASAWGDFNGDGKLDLATWDGKALSLISQKKDGSFTPPEEVVDVPEGECSGLTALDVGVSGRAGLLWGRAEGPALLVSGKQEGKKFEVSYLQAGNLWKSLGTRGSPLVADFDGDGLADVLQSGASGSLLFMAKAVGEYRAPERCDIAAGKGRFSTFLGDFDMDGLLDVMSLNPKTGFSIWQNGLGPAADKRKRPAFRDVMHLSGQIRYILRPDALYGSVCDFNSDGRQDVLFSHATEKKMSFFFNFGCRSLKSAPEFDMQLGELLAAKRFPGLRPVAADFDGDGAQDLAAATADGRLYVCLRRLRVKDEEDSQKVLRIVLPAGGVTAGPVKVTGWGDWHCMGSWNVTAGGPGAFFGLLEPGRVKLRWRLPGGKEATKEVVLEEKSIRFVIPADGGRKK